MKRQRGRGRKPGGGGGGGGNQGNRPFESNGPDVKIRGTAAQIYEKYSQYARDAQSSGDRVKYESYLQHAEHYFRIMAATMPRDQRPQPHGEIGMGSPQQSDEQESEESSNDAMKVVDEGSDDDGSDGDEAEARDGDDAEASGAESAGAEGGGEERQEGRGRRRRGRRRNGDGGHQQGGERASGGNGGDTEARSALDSLARKQGALTGG